eukprot:4735174-Pyramimonas_sp.AAC.1
MCRCAWQYPPSRCGGNCSRGYIFVLRPARKSPEGASTSWGYFLIRGPQGEVQRAVRTRLEHNARESR